LIINVFETRIVNWRGYHDICAQGNLEEWAIEHGGEEKGYVSRFENAMHCVSGPVGYCQLYFSYLGRMMSHTEYRTIAQEAGLEIHSGFEEQRDKKGFVFAEYCGFCLRRGLRDMSTVGPSYLILIAVIMGMGLAVNLFHLPLLAILIFNWVLCLLLPLGLWIAFHTVLHEALEEGEALRKARAIGSSSIPTAQAYKGHMPRRKFALQVMRLSMLLACYGAARTVTTCVVRSEDFDHIWMEGPGECVVVLIFAMLFMYFIGHIYAQVFVMLMLAFGAPPYCQLDDYKELCDDMVVELQAEAAVQKGQNAFDMTGRASRLARRNSLSLARDST
jgi:hypothetical protein